MKELWTRFTQDESGQGLVEYVLIVAVVAIGVIAAMLIFRNKISNSFNAVGDTVAKYPGAGS